MTPSEMDGMFALGVGFVILVGFTVVNALNPRARTLDGSLAGCLAWALGILIVGGIIMAALGVDSAGPIGIVPR